MPLQPTLEGDAIVTRHRPFALQGGSSLDRVSIRYAMYGDLNKRRDNVVLMCHALSGSARAADWWPEMFDGVFDISRHCVLCSNILGSCYGSTGPSSINPATGLPYGPDFPLITIRDVVRAQARVHDELGIQRLQVVIGASIGGMQALQWAVEFPERVGHCIAIGTAPLSAMGLALNHLQRQAIRTDPAFNDGRYPPGEQPAKGLGLARALAMCSYKSPELFDDRYGRKSNRNGEDPGRSLTGRYDVAGYLDYQGEKFVQRFDANAYMTISKMMDTFDLAQGHASEEDALKRIQARVSLVGISSDWLFPPKDVRALAKRIKAAGGTCDYAEFETPHGHDGFLAEVDAIAAVVSGSFTHLKSLL